MASRIDELIERQADEIAAFDEREVKAFLRAMDDARRSLRDRLQALGDGKTTFTAQRLRTALVQVEAAQLELQDRLGRQLGASIEAVDRKGLAHTLAIVRKAERKFRDAGGAIEFGALRKISESRDLQLMQLQTSLRRYGAEVVDKIHRQLVLGVVSGDSLDQLTDRIARTDGVFAANSGRAELIARMELNAAYNRSTQDTIEELAASDDPNDPDPMLRKACEFRDLRNNAISRVLDGTITAVKSPFRISVAEVQVEHAKLNAQRAAARLPTRRLGGIVWPIVGANYVGFNYPAHFRDRGRIVPWRRSWGT